MTFRQQIICLDGYQCRNPQCLSVLAENPFTQYHFSVHHIKYKSHQGPDTKENTITLCKLCDHAAHHGHGKGEDHVCGRVFVLRILNGLSEAVDDRWQEAREELRLRYGLVCHPDDVIITKEAVRRAKRFTESQGAEK